jgi:probable addiction module antidote protein
LERLAAKEEAMISTAKHDDWLFEQLKDATFAAEYINAASEDDDPKTYLTALRKVVEARGGLALIAERAHVSRETLYRTLSSRGNPTVKTLIAVLKAAGLKLGVSAY